MHRFTPEISLELLEFCHAAELFRSLRCLTLTRRAAADETWRGPLLGYPAFKRTLLLTGNTADINLNQCTVSQSLWFNWGFYLLICWLIIIIKGAQLGKLLTFFWSAGGFADVYLYVCVVRCADTFNWVWRQIAASTSSPPWASWCFWETTCTCSLWLALIHMPPSVACSALTSAIPKKICSRHKTDRCTLLWIHLQTPAHVQALISNSLLTCAELPWGNYGYGFSWCTTLQRFPVCVQPSASAPLQNVPRDHQRGLSAFACHVSFLCLMSVKRRVPSQAGDGKVGQGERWKEGRAEV